MSHLYVSPSGTNWMDLDDDDDDLQILAPDTNEPDECDELECDEHNERDEHDDADNADDAAICAVENGQAGVYNAADEYYDEAPVSYNVANAMYLNQIWSICRALPAYNEFSFDEYSYYPFVRVRYRTNWLDFKLCMGGDLDTPMRMRFSPLRLSLTREYDEKGDFIIHEAGTLIDGPLVAHAEFKPLPDNSEPEEQAEELETPPRSPPCAPEFTDDDEPQTPPRSPPCVPGFRDEDELRDYGSEPEAEGPSPCHDDGSSAYGSFIRFYCDESGEVIDTEQDVNEAETCARSTSDEYTGSSAESSSEQLNDSASPSTSVSSAFSESSEDGVPESDVASTSGCEDDDVCVTLDATPTNIQEGVVFTESMEAVTQPITTAIEGIHTIPMCLDTVSSSEITDNTSTSAAAHRSVCKSLVSDEDAQTVPVSILDFAVDVAVVKLPPGVMPTPECADDKPTEQPTEEVGAVPEDSESSSGITSPAPVTIEADVISATDLSTTKVESHDYTPPADCTEDVATGYVDSPTTLIEDAGVPPDTVFCQPPPTTPLVWDVVCTAGFALSSLPWLRMGVAAAGIVVDVAATLLHR